MEKLLFLGDEGPILPGTQRLQLRQSWVSRGPAMDMIASQAPPSHGPIRKNMKGGCSVIPPPPVSYLEHGAGPTRDHEGRNRVVLRHARRVRCRRWRWCSSHAAKGPVIIGTTLSPETCKPTTQQGQWYRCSSGPLAWRHEGPHFPRHSRRIPRTTDSDATVQERGIVEPM